LGANCTVENTPYIAYGASGKFINIVSQYVHLYPCFVSNSKDFAEAIINLAFIVILCKHYV